MYAQNVGGVLQVTLRDVFFNDFKVTNENQNIKWTELSLTQPSVTKKGRHVPRIRPRGGGGAEV